MNVVLSPEAAEGLAAQIGFLRDAEAFDAAERLRVRMMGFLSNHLARFPRTGRWVKSRDLWEMRVPRTRLIIWYRIEPERIVVATVWHASQNRSTANP